MKNTPWGITLLRGIVALVFLASGFVKGIDPWGTALKLQEYFAAFLGGTLPERWAFVGSIGLSAGEMVLGLCLLFRIRERLVTRWSMILLVLFTLLTALLWIWNPVSDCGCFGDFLKLSNAQTLLKNLVLTGCIGVVWHYTRRHTLTKSPREISIVESGMIFGFVLFAVGVGLYSLRHLPPIDFLPFRVGTNIAAALQQPASPMTHTTLLYKDRTTGTTREFAVEDTTWYDTVRWEYLDTRVEELPQRAPSSARRAIDSFALFDAQQDHTAEVLGCPTELFLLPLRAEAELSAACRQRMLEVVRYAQKHHYPLYGITPEARPASGVWQWEGVSIPVLNVDATTLKMLLRSSSGVVLLKEGTILGKWSCRDIPSFRPPYDSLSPLEIVLLQQEAARLRWMLGVLGGVVLLSCGVYLGWRRRQRL